MASPVRPFSIRWFSFWVAAQYAALLIVFSFVAPTTWSRQLEAGVWAFVVVFLAGKMYNCFFEWGFHRYVLHGRMHPWLSRFSHAHRHHHALTPIREQRSDVGPGRMILNEYPITKVAQYEDAAFPWYALVAFWGLYSPLLISLQYLFPMWPILLGGTAAITSSMFDYEVLHAIEHKPYEWWKKVTEDKDHPRWAHVWRLIYGFHHFHHANIKTNEAISGFFGLPVADWVFRTYNQPPDLLFHGRIVTAGMFEIRQPWPFVTWLDDWTQRRESNIIHRREK